MAIELPEGRSESNGVLDALRVRAVHARQLGYAVVDIAAILGVREETCQWTRIVTRLVNPNCYEA